MGKASLPAWLIGSRSNLQLNAEMLFFRVVVGLLIGLQLCAARQSDVKARAEDSRVSQLIKYHSNHTTIPAQPCQLDMD